METVLERSEPADQTAPRCNGNSKGVHTCGSGQVCQEPLRLPAGLPCQSVDEKAHLLISSYISATSSALRSAMLR